VKEPTAVALATATKTGLPSVRMVLLKGFDADGAGGAGVEGSFVFFTNYESRKGRHLAENPEAALCFFWDGLARQVRAEGKVERVSAAESDAYFSSRPVDSQIGAWASQQSRPTVEGGLEKRLAEVKATFAAGGKIERPAYWGGYRLTPRRVEFWEGKQFRLHDRFEFTRDARGIWQRQWLFP
jgi:pyridoxamine 5'-phosphate oxidase